MVWTLKVGRLSVGLAFLALASSSQAQGLYAIAPNDDEADSSSPLTYLVGVSFGYDNLLRPIARPSILGSQSQALRSVTETWASHDSESVRQRIAQLGEREQSYDGGDNTRDNVQTICSCTELVVIDDLNQQFAVVPEPSQGLLVAVSAMFFLRRRRVENLG